MKETAQLDDRLAVSDAIKYQHGLNGIVVSLSDGRQLEIKLIDTDGDWYKGYLLSDRRKSVQLNLHTGVVVIE